MSKKIKAWAIADGNRIGMVHITPEVSCYQIFDTKVDHPFYQRKFIEVEISFPKKLKKKSRT